MVRDRDRSRDRGGIGAAGQPREAMTPGKRTHTENLVYLGLNKFAHNEGRKLQEVSQDQGGAEVISPDPHGKQDQISQGGTSYDLSDRTQRDAFLATLQ